MPVMKVFCKNWFFLSRVPGVKRVALIEPRGFSCPLAGN